MLHHGSPFRTVLLFSAALGLAAACKRSNGGLAMGAGGSAGGAGRTGQGGASAGRSGASGGNTTGLGGAGTAGQSGVWTAVQDTGPCVLETADPARLTTLPFSWSICGLGCKESPARVLATDDTVFEGIATARVEGNDVLVRLGTMRTSSYKMIALRRLSDGALLAAVRAPGETTTSCGMMGFAPSAPRVFAFAKGDAIVVGFYRPGGAVWSPPISSVVLPQSSVLENDLGWGMGLNDGSLRTMFPPGGGTLTTIDQSRYPAYSAVGWGNLVVSNPAPDGGDEVIRAWEPDHPSRTIVAQADTSIPRLALSNTAVVWVGAHGPGRADGAYTAAELYWTPWPGGQDTAPIRGGTTLPAIAGFASMQTWGDYAALLGTLPGATTRTMFVVRLSDERLWTIAAPTGSIYVNVLALTVNEILFAANDNSGDPSLAWQIQRLARYELARLDDLAAR